MSALALLLAAWAAAQGSPAPYGSPEPAPAPAASTAAPAASSSATAPGDGVHVAAGAPKPKLRRPMRAVIPKEAADWEPLGVKEGGDPHQASTSATLRVVRTAKGGYKGERSKAKAVVRSYAPADGERRLVIAVFPRALEARRKHFELRLRVVEGFVEKAEAALVTVRVRPGRLQPPARADSVLLRRGGFAFEEELAASGEAVLSALDPRPGKSSWNAGRLVRAEFPDREAGFADVSWSLRGVETSPP